jgi:hypothetical protein
MLPEASYQLVNKRQAGGPPADALLKLIASPNVEYKELIAKVQDAG